MRLLKFLLNHHVEKSVGGFCRAQQCCKVNISLQAVALIEPERGKHLAETLATFGKLSAGVVTAGRPASRAAQPAA